MVSPKLYLTCFVVLSMHTGLTHGFQCFRDSCEAGRQYCVQERERCFLCSDRESECGLATMPSDCAAFCSEVVLRKRLSEINETNSKLETQELQCMEHLNKSHAEIMQLSEQITDTQQKYGILKIENTELAKQISELHNKTESMNVSENRNTEIHLKRISHLQNEIKDWKIGCVVGWVLLLLSIVWQTKKCLLRQFKRKKNLPDDEKLLSQNELHAGAREPESVVIDMNKEEMRVSEYQDSAMGSASSLDSETRDSEGGRQHTEVNLDSRPKKRAGPTSDSGCECGHPHGTGVKPCKCNLPVAPTKGENSERAAMAVNPTPIMTVA
ncbi:uncharacterized protein LOC124120155 [Haliotis rufescens]|uniref:uncharacterized protein LOC124120155 n=1 Tax=Haliotis rufescens TaxID=6454 RepID=UPI00201F56FF|nr:uncharacterized protein LOC124120155 [Haliotis rufescens]